MIGAMKMYQTLFVRLPELIAPANFAQITAAPKKLVFGMRMKMTLNHRSLVTITRSDLNDATAAASEHIAPCGHNELENIYAAVEAAFHAVGLEVEPPVIAATESLTPDMVNISDFDGFSNEILATFCRRWPGTNEARAAKAALVERRSLSYGSACQEPWKCISKGYCPRDPNCAD